MGSRGERKLPASAVERSQLNLKTREELETAIKEIESGKLVSLEKLAKELGF